MTFGLDALKKVLILFRHITTESAIEVPLHPKKRKKGRKFLSLFDSDRKQDMKAQFTWAARSQISFLPFSSTRAGPEGHFFPLKLRAIGPFTIHSQMVKEEFRRKNVTN